MADGQTACQDVLMRGEYCSGSEVFIVRGASWTRWKAIVTE